MNLKNERKEQQERRKHNLLTEILFVSLRKVSVTAYLFFIFIFTFSVVSGQDSAENVFFNKNYYKVFDLQFEEVQREIQSLDSDDPTRIYFEHLLEAIPLFIWENDEDYSTFKDNTDERISILRGIKENSPQKGFVLAEIRLHESILDIKFGKNLYAAINFNKAHRNIERNIRDYPNFILQYKTAGLIDVVTGSVPDNYNWLVSLFGFSKDVDEGLKKISLSSDFSEVINQETNILNAATQIFLLGGPLDQDILSDDDSSPFLFKYIASFLYNKNGNGESAFELSEALINSSSDKLEKLPHTYYLEGINLLQRGEYRASIKNLKLFRSTFTGFNLIKDANYKLAVGYQILGMNDSSEYFLERVLASGNTFTESDKYAERTAQSDRLPKPVINQLRLFTDGGYYSKAEDLIRENDDLINSDDEDYLEWEYRKARLYHRNNLPDKSVPYYKEVIEAGDKYRGSYFPPNSCLQLGYIFLSKGDLEESENYFKRVFDYSKFPYESSIKNKAKSGLNQLKSK